MPAAKSQPLGVRIGFVLMAIGLVFLAVVVIPFFFGDHNRPVWINVACMLAPIGFVVVIVSVVRTGRADQRQALAAHRARVTE